MWANSFSSAASFSAVDGVATFARGARRRERCGRAWLRVRGGERLGCARVRAHSRGVRDEFSPHSARRPRCCPRVVFRGLGGRAFSARARHRRSAARPRSQTRGGGGARSGSPRPMRIVRGVAASFASLWRRARRQRGVALRVCATWDASRRRRASACQATSSAMVKFSAPTITDVVVLRVFKAARMSVDTLDLVKMAALLRAVFVDDNADGDGGGRNDDAGGGGARRLRRRDAEVRRGRRRPSRRWRTGGADAPCRDRGAQPQRFWRPPSRCSRSCAQHIGAREELEANESGAARRRARRRARARARGAGRGGAGRWWR